MLLTAPTSYRRGKTPDFLRPLFIGPDDDVAQLHDDYADRVRDVASETGAPLCDLLKRFAELPRRRRVASFRDDGVHLRPSGDARLARFLHECFVAHDAVSLLLDEESAPRRAPPPR